MKNSIKLNYEDNYIRSILDNTKTIAMIGLSPSWNRPSYFVAKYLIDRGYKIFPINPKISGKKIKRIIQYGRSTFFCPDVQFEKKKKIIKY